MTQTRPIEKRRKNALLLLLLIALAPTLFHIGSVKADTPEAAEDAVIKAREEYFDALESGKPKTAAERNQLFESTLGAAMKRMDAADAEQAERHKQKELEKQRNNAATWAKKHPQPSKKHSRMNSSANTQNLDSIRNIQNGKTTAPRDELSPEPVALDGNNAPRELNFSGKTKTIPEKKH